MSAKPTTQPAATNPQQNKPQAPAPAATQGKPAPAPATAAQQKPTPPAPKPAVPAFAFPDVTAAKNTLRTRFPNMFNTDGEFNAMNVDTTTAQGFRFKMERSAGLLTTQFIPILKFGGLLKPGLLLSKTKFLSKQIDIMNLFTQKTFITLRLQANKTWDIVNAENNNAVQGNIKVSQEGDIKKIQLLLNNVKKIEAQFKCPVQKTGCCAAPRPAQLLSIGFSIVSNGADFEENPNGDACKDSLEVNAYYKSARDAGDFIMYAALLQVAAIELL